MHVFMYKPIYLYNAYNEWYSPVHKTREHGLCVGLMQKEKFLC